MYRTFTLKCTHLSAKSTHYSAKAETVNFPISEMYFCSISPYPLPFARSADTPSVLRAPNELELLGGRGRTHEERGKNEEKNHVWPV